MGTFSGFSYHIAPRALNLDREFAPPFLFADSVRHVLNGHVAADQYYVVSTTSSVREMSESTLECRMRQLFSLDLNPLIAMTRQLDSELSFFKAWNTWQKYTLLPVSTIVRGQSPDKFEIKREKISYQFDPPAARDAALCAFDILSRDARGRRAKPTGTPVRQALRLSDVAAALCIRDAAVLEAVLCLEEVRGLKVEELCRHVGCHTRTLERHLKAAGLTAVDLKMACALIGATNMLWGTSSLAEVAHENGFSDQSHMARAFRRACFLPPSVLRSLAVKTEEKGGESPP